MAARPNQPMCLAMLTYIQPLETVDVHRAAHVAWIEAAMADGAMLLAGRRNPATGGVLLFRGDAQTVERLAHADPFVVNGVATVEIVAFTATLATEALGELL